MKLLHQIKSIIITLLFICALNFKSIVTIYFYANQAKIIELFCINKEKPQLQCNGKCHLTKELNKVEDDKEEKPFSNSNSMQNLELAFTLFTENINQQLAVDQLKKKWISSNENLVTGYNSTPSPPPKI